MQKGKAPKVSVSKAKATEKEKEEATKKKTEKIEVKWLRITAIIEIPLGREELEVLDEAFGSLGATQLMQAVIENKHINELRDLIDGLTNDSGKIHILDATFELKSIVDE